MCFREDVYEDSCLHVPEMSTILSKKCYHDNCTLCSLSTEVICGIYVSQVFSKDTLTMHARQEGEIDTRGPGRSNCFHLILS